MKKKELITETDLKSWEEYIKDPKDLFDKELKTHKNSINKRFKFDFHGFGLEEANIKAKEILINCFERKCTEILFITGKGIHSNTKKKVFVSENLSKLKYSIPDYINSNLELSKIVRSINSADLKDGGEGAIIIKLNKSII